MGAAAWHLLEIEATFCNGTPNRNIYVPDITSRTHVLELETEASGLTFVANWGLMT